VSRDAEAFTGTPAETLDEAQRLLDAGRPFEAHEVLEDAWKAAPAAERDLWRGLAQLAVGLTHAARGNRAGAAALIARGAGNLEGYRDGAPYRIDVPGLLAWAVAAAAEPVAGVSVPRLVSPPVRP
jgi:predicted metal-dependent hydrolase